MNHQNKNNRFMCVILFIWSPNSYFHLYSDMGRKKLSQERLDTIEQRIGHFMEYSISNINNHFTPLQKTISLLVNKLQVHLDIFSEHTHTHTHTQKKNEQKLADIGFITYDLCLNAQTAEKHTECDASYTVIKVPNQITTKFLDGKKKQRKI